MSNGFPSMTALLGLLAVAGFQNRDKIGEFLGGLGQDASRQPGGPQPGSLQPAGAGMAGGLGGLLGGLGAGTSPGGFLSGGLGELVDRFKQNGHGEAAQSWVGPGANTELAPTQLEQAIGPDVLATLSQRTGLSREDLLSRLAKELPRAVDQYTPDGRIPA